MPPLTRAAMVSMRLTSNSTVTKTVGRWFTGGSSTLWRITKTATDSATSASSSTHHHFTITPPPNLPTSPSRRHPNNPPPHHLANPPPRLPTSPPPHFLTFAHRHSLDLRIPTPLLGSPGGELGLVRRVTPGCRNLGGLKAGR